MIAAENRMEKTRNLISAQHLLYYQTAAFPCNIRIYDFMVIPDICAAVPRPIASYRPTVRHPASLSRRVFLDFRRFHLIHHLSSHVTTSTPPPPHTRSWVSEKVLESFLHT